jgi:phospholipid/cholesterol/gamma-HCH transport system substrate-binding protein
VKKSHTNDWMVGAAILATMVLIVASTLFLQQADLGDKRQTISARFRDVGNLQVGNVVVIRGVRSGKVREIALADRGWVVVEMDLDEGIALPTDPVVLIQSSSLLGEFQALVSARSGVPQIREVESQLDDAAGAPPNAFPGAVLPDIAQLTTVAGGIAGNVASVAERVRTAFDDSAARELRTSIRNFSAMSRDLAQAVRVQSRNLDSIAVHVRSSVADLSRTAEAVRNATGRVDSATASGEIANIVKETELATTNLRAASARINDLTIALQQSEANLRGVIAKSDSVMGKVNRGEGSLGLLVNDQSLYRNSDSLLIDLRTLIQDFRKDPKRYFSLRVF